MRIPVKLSLNSHSCPYSASHLDPGPYNFKKNAMSRRKSSGTSKATDDILAQFALFASKFGTNTSPFEAYANILNIDVKIKEGNVCNKMEDLMALFNKWEFEDKDRGPSIRFSRHFDDSAIVQHNIESVFMHHIRDTSHIMTKPTGYKNEFPSILFQFEQYDFNPLSSTLRCKNNGLIAYPVIRGRRNICINIELGSSLAEIFHDAQFTSIDSSIDVKYSKMIAT